MEIVKEKPQGKPESEPHAPVEKKSNRRWVILGAVVAVGLAILGGYYLLTAGEEHTDDAQVSADLVPVGARAAGPIVRVAIKENQLVHKGELLVEIDDADYAAKLKQAEAELATAQAQAQAADAQVDVTTANSKGGFTSAQAALSGSSTSVASADAQLQAAHAAVARAQADLKKADIDLSRKKELRTANAVPQEMLDNAQIAYDQATAALAQAKAQEAQATESRRMAETRVVEARGRLSASAPVSAIVASARAQADLAHAKVKAAEASLELARLQLSYTKVVSPADGVASKLSVHEGQQVQVGQPVIELVPTGTYLIANFKETQIGKMKPGDKAEIEIDAFPGKKLEGRVESLAGGTGASFSLLPPDNASGNFVKVVQRVPVRISWVNAPSDLPLRAGLSADVTVHVGR